MGGNIVNVCVVPGSSLPPAVSGGRGTRAGRKFGMLLGPEGTSSPLSHLRGGVGVLVSSAPGAGLALIPVPVLPFSLLRGGGGSGSSGGWCDGFVGWWVFVNWIVDASIL